jgi:AraC-like DNA-binding protein
MPSSEVRTFTDPEDFAASFLSNVKLTILKRGSFAAKRINVDLGRLQVNRCFDELPRVGHSAEIAERAIISFRTHPGPNLTRDGLQMSMPNLIWRRTAASFFQKSDGFANWGAMSLPLEQLDAMGTTFAGCDLTPPKDALSVTPSSVAMARLQRLHAAAGQLAEDAPAVIAHPEAARSLEQALIGAAVECLRSGQTGEDRSALRQHAKIMRKFYSIVEERGDEALYVPELCASIGVSERTLRICCQEQLGVSPKRYVLLRRMHLVHQALREGDRNTTTVTEIATRYGFWQFGRFAGEYKAIFDELPSITLASQHFCRN